MFFHFDFTNYRRMVALAYKEPNAVVRRWYLAVLLAAVPTVATFHAVCFFLDNLLFPGLWTTRVRAPVFVVGHARSGTTLLHRLMSEDAGRFSSFRLYELYFPSLLQKKVLRAIGRIDRRWLGGTIDRRVRAWEEKRYAALRGVHKMGLREPEEDDLVLYYSCASGFWITKMPYMGDLDFYQVDRWPEARRRRLMRFYAACVRRQLYLNGTEKTHLSKNPVFAGRVEALIEQFPDARFIVPVRNPNETIPSLLKLMAGGWKRLGWPPDRMRRCLGILAEQSFHTYLHPIETLERHADVPSTVVDYRDAVADPAATVEAVYRDLGIPMSDGYRDALRAMGTKERAHVSRHSYSLEEFGLDADAIRTRLAPLFERYGWDEPEVAE